MSLFGNINQGLEEYQRTPQHLEGMKKLGRQGICAGGLSKRTF